MSKETKYPWRNVGFDPTVWQPRGALPIPIFEMETDHIINCIRMIKRSGGLWRPEQLAVLEAELRDRGVAYQEDPKGFDLGDAHALAMRNAREN